MKECLRQSALCRWMAIVRTVPRPSYTHPLFLSQASQAGIKVGSSPSWTALQRPFTSTPPSAIGLDTVFLFRQCIRVLRPSRSTGEPLPQDMPPVHFGALAITINTTASHLAQPCHAPNPIRAPSASASASSWSLSLLYPRRHQYRRRFCTTLEANNGALLIGPTMHCCLHQAYVKLISRHASPTPQPSNQIDPASAAPARSVSFPCHRPSFSAPF